METNDEQPPGTGGPPALSSIPPQAPQTSFLNCTHLQPGLCPEQVCSPESQQPTSSETSIPLTPQKAQGQAPLTSHVAIP